MTKLLSLSRFALALALLALGCASPAFAAGGSGLALSVDGGAAGGAQMTSADGMPTAKFGAELGAHVNNKTLFFGLYGDLYSGSLWGGGLTGRQYFGGSRLFWAQIKLSLIGWAAMTNSSDQVTWTDRIEGGVGLGMRIPMSNSMNLQPYVEFDSFTPIRTLNSLGSKVHIPMAGVRLAMEL